jgi:hypothetical protein
MEQMIPSLVGFEETTMQKRPGVELTPADRDEIGTALSAIAVQGDRYPAHLQQRVDR